MKNITIYKYIHLSNDNNKDKISINLKEIILIKTICSLILAVTIICFIPNKSYAIESVTIDNGQYSTTKSTPKGRTNAKSCKSLLNKKSYKTEQIKRDYSRPAKKAAILGVVFGIKFATGPKEIRNKKKASLTMWSIDNQNKPEAMAVAAYRKCKNEEALKSITEWK